MEYPVTLTNGLDEFVFVNPAFTARYGWLEEEVVGLRPSFLLPQNFPESDLRLLRKRMAEVGAIWVGRVKNRDKHGAVFEIELATFQISLAEDLPPNLLLGIIANVGELAEAMNQFGGAMCRMAFKIKSEAGEPLRQLDKHQQIANLHAHGYTTKEIAGFMRVGLNTPHVIMHRARRKNTS